MVRLTGLGIAAASAVMLTGLANAADMPGLPPPSVVPVVPVVDWLGTGWYVRGDLGWRSGLIDSADAPRGFIDPTNNTLGKGIVGGGGVGIKSRWFRTDWTIDYASPATYGGTAVAPNDVRAKIQSLNILFNGYFDLGTWHRLTPYIGGGAGAALVRVSDYQSVVTPPLTGNGGHSEWNFAYAGMTGVAWAVAPNLMIDFGYRYLNVGDAHTARDASGALTFKSVAAHEARIGLRWNFDDLREYH
jgi:opacity protein-like surface antigen